MRKIILLIAVIPVLLFSCDGYKNEPVSSEDISSLNETVVNAQKTGETWTRSPEEIVRYLYPPVSHDGGPKLYEINKKVKSSTGCIVTVTEEGPIDDEVLGLRSTLYFRHIDSIWTIVDLKHETKRRP